MFDFNWGIFWALLAAFAVRGTIRYVVKETRVHRERMQHLKDFPPIPPYNG
jgi:hypothetical protein